MQKRQKPGPPTLYKEFPLSPAFPLWVCRGVPEADGGSAHGTLVERHSGLEIGYCHEGEGVVSVAGRVFLFGARSIVVVPPMVPHGTWGPEGLGSTWSYLLADPVRLLGGLGKNADLLDPTRFSGPKCPSVFAGAEHPEIERLLTDILEEDERKNRLHEEAIRGYLLALLVALNRIAGPAPRKADTPARPGAVERIIPALRHIQCEYARKISADGLAKTCGMGKSSFRQTFSQVMGKGPYEYLTEYRIAIACLELREARKTVEAVAWDNGFPTVSCFLRKFRDIMHMTPSQWAKQR
ncbi:MAG: helix-turn-helix transcriptional regulator [Kiritimatiellae bacterium]|nr:helix-turn-helix transcriptional regulator [Kiritimatiellia bacterium]